ncbi:MAG: hypothetical protein FWD68_08280 [Alphaproteobacteria bacterium]|nr:hypothetical protein [Alphaproteobacteria bacterium]
MSGLFSAGHVTGIVEKTEIAEPDLENRMGPPFNAEEASPDRADGGLEPVLMVERHHAHPHLEVTLEEVSQHEPHGTVFLLLQFGRYRFFGMLIRRDQFEVAKSIPLHVGLDQDRLSGIDRDTCRLDLGQGRKALVESGAILLFENDPKTGLAFRSRGRSLIRLSAVTMRGGKTESRAGLAQIAFHADAVGNRGWQC